MLKKWGRYIRADYFLAELLLMKSVQLTFLEELELVEINFDELFELNLSFLNLYSQCWALTIKCFFIQQPVTYNVQGDQLSIRLVAATDTSPNGGLFVTEWRIWVSYDVSRIAPDYLNELTTEEIVKLLDNEAVQCIAQKYYRNGSGILEELDNLKVN